MIEKKVKWYQLSDKWYDRLKWVAQYLLPGAATLYFALSNVWGFPYTEQVVGTIVAVDTFLGALLGLSAMAYNKLKEAEGYMSENLPVEEGPTVVKKSALSSDTYDILKWVARIALPSSGALYFALSQLWGWPYGEQVVGTVAAFTTFLGLLLGFSTMQFNKN